MSTMKDSCGVLSAINMQCEEDKTISATSPKTQGPDDIVTSPSKLESILEVDECRDGEQESVEEQRNFDVNPTELYRSLMRKDFDLALKLVTEFPKESRIWIYRRESNGNLRWKLLPLHASIIFDAPLPVVQAVVNAFPAATGKPDDQGMVPLHLAIRMNKSPDIVKALISEAAIAARDRKGRTPKALAARSTTVSPDVLESLQSYVPQFAAASPKSAAAAFSLSIDELKEAHSLELERLSREHNTKVVGLTAKIGVLETEIAKLPGLESTIRDYEATVKELREIDNTRQDEFQRLKTELEETRAAKEKSDNANKAVITNLVAQVGDLQGKLHTATTDKDTAEQKFAELQEKTKEDVSGFIKQVSDLEVRLESVTTERDDAQKEVERTRTLLKKSSQQNEAFDTEVESLGIRLAKTERKLEEVTVSEQELAWQNESLTEKLKASADTTGLLAERDELRATVQKLSMKLYKVVGFLDEMVQEQEALINESTSDDSPNGGVGGKSLTAASTAWKEQIGAVIDSVIQGLPNLDEEEEEGGRMSEEKKVEDVVVLP
jgi:ankyrin repeat protein